MKRVLVTGANGWIGSHALYRLIEKGYEVHAVSRKKIEYSNLQCKWYKADLLNFCEIEQLMQQVKPTHLLHFAWEVTPGQYLNSLDNYVWVQASIELLQHFMKHGGKRAVMAGTCFEYNWEYGYLSEDITPCSNTTPYAASKNALQNLLRSFSETSGLSSAWGRIFFLYGPGEHRDRLVSYIINSLLKDKKALCTHGEQYRDFMHVQDVAEAFIALLESDIQGPVNIASGYSRKVKELIYEIADLLGKRELVQLGVVPYNSKEATFIAANTKRLKEEVKWAPKFNLEAGIKQTISWWKAQYTGK